MYWFITGLDEKVKCFSCNGGLDNWLPGDVPWIEHARWFPDCQYVHKKMGSGFVSHVQNTEDTQGKHIVNILSYKYY